MRLSYHRGYRGAFTRDQAEGAIPNHSRVVKRASEPGDGTPDGTMGTVLGSIDSEKISAEIAQRFGSRFGYWIEWDTAPRCAVFVTDKKIAVLQ